MAVDPWGTIIAECTDAPSAEEMETGSFELAEYVLYLGTPIQT